ncbi:MAG: hypothetical protein SNF33_07815 [Candidatus Algichlamydia australiensis]|nr:hypothetical protein [Chlamydiales bacterium]
MPGRIGEFVSGFNPVGSSSTFVSSDKIRMVSENIFNYLNMETRSVTKRELVFLGVICALSISIIVLVNKKLGTHPTNPEKREDPPKISSSPKKNKKKPTDPKMKENLPVKADAPSKAKELSPQASIKILSEEEIKQSLLADQASSTAKLQHRLERENFLESWSKNITFAPINQGAEAIYSICGNPCMACSITFLEKIPYISEKDLTPDWLVTILNIGAIRKAESGHGANLIFFEDIPNTSLQREVEDSKYLPFEKDLAYDNICIYFLPKIAYQNKLMGWLSDDNTLALLTHCGKTFAVARVNWNEKTKWLVFDSHGMTQKKVKNNGAFVAKFDKVGDLALFLSGFHYPKKDSDYEDQIRQFSQEKTEQDYQSIKESFKKYFPHIALTEEHYRAFFSDLVEYPERQKRRACKRSLRSTGSCKLARNHSSKV